MAEPRLKPDPADAPPTRRPDDARLPLRVVTRNTGATTPSRQWRRAGRVLAVLVTAVVLVAAGGFVGLYFQPPGLRATLAALSLEPGGGASLRARMPAAEKAATEAARVGAGTRRDVVGLGRLAPAGEVVAVAAPYGASDARIARLAVEEGDTVALGDILAELDNKRALRASRLAAEAAVATREAELAQTRASVRASRDEAAAALARAEAVGRYARRERDRFATLRERGVSADAAFEEKEIALDEALREIDQARAALSRFGSGALDDQEDVQVAAQAVNAARAEVARADADLDAAVVRAPTDATVLDIHVRAGERPGDAGVLDLGDLSQMKATVEVYQDQIGGVVLGDAVEITAVALPQPLRGVVERIGLEIGRQSQVDADPAANTDARVVKVEVALDPASSAIAGRFTGLEVLARIAAEERS